MRLGIKMVERKEKLAYKRKGQSKVNRMKEHHKKGRLTGALKIERNTLQRLDQQNNAI